MDPSRTGYFEYTPTAIPVLRRLDVIEVEEEPYATEVGGPKGEDLATAQLEYTFGPGDQLDVQINELFQEGKAENFRRTVDQAGMILLPVVGSVHAVGLTQQQLVTEISDRLKAHLPNPQVDVTVVEGRAFTFTVDGAVQNPGVYSLSRPDFDVRQAVALAGGSPAGIRTVLVVRVIEDVEADEMEGAPATQKPAKTPGTKPTQPAKPAEQPAQPEAPSIDDLINQIAPPSNGQPAPSGQPNPAAQPAPAPAPAPAPPPPPGTEPAPTTPPIEPPAPPPAEPTAPPAPSAPPATAPGAMRTQSVPPDVAPPVEAPVEAPSTQDKPVPNPAQATVAPPKRAPSSEAQYYFDQQKQEWILVPAAEARAIEAGNPALRPNSPQGAVTGSVASQATAGALMKPGSFRLPTGQKTRVINVDWIRLQRGDLRQNVIIHPGDKVYVQPVDGVVYIDGEIARPGVYSMPQVGELTLSRLVSAAGGLGQVAIPQRVDLIRKISVDREAAIRVNLAAIRNRAEPDIALRPDDQIIIGTNFFATPLAVIRNGFRMTYGFGFLLDRNFGNDVFGAPPVNVVGQ